MGGNGNRPVLAMVESNTTGTGRMFAVAARARGLRPVLLGRRSERYSWLAEEGVEAARADTTDAESVLAVARATAGSAGVAGVVSSSEYFVAVAARVARRLRLPGADPTAVDRCRDKRRQRAALACAGIPVPGWGAAGTPKQAAAAAAAIGFPVVVKPADGTGSRGVRLCGDAAEVAGHSAALLGAGRDERDQPSLPAVLVEEYVAGPEFSVETWGTAVAAITAKHLGPLPCFVEIGHDVPADLVPGRNRLRPETGKGPAAQPVAVASGHAAAQGLLEATAVAAIRALGLGFGPAHVEIRLGPRGPVVIEVNPRLAGGRIPTLVRLATGLDLIGATVAAVTGAGGGLPEPGPGHASIRFLVVPRAGRVRRTGGVAAAAAVPGVVDVAISARAGQRVGGTGSFLDRVGHVIAAGPAAAAARTAAETALARLELDIDAAVGAA